MAFVVPTFNLTGNVWHVASYAPHVWPLPLPDLVVGCNLSYSKGRNQNVLMLQVTGTLVPVVGVELLVPKRSDLRGHTLSGWNGDLVEVPAGSGRYYAVAFVEDVARGFLNEYRIATMCQITSEMISLTGSLVSASALWPLPTP